MANSPQVLCCPKCGSDDISFGHSAPPWSATVECHEEDCRALMLDFESESRAIIRWNAGNWNGVISVDDDGFNVFNPLRGFRSRQGGAAREQITGAVIPVSQDTPDHRPLFDGGE